MQTTNVPKSGATAKDTTLASLIDAVTSPLHDVHDVLLPLRDDRKLSRFRIAMQTSQSRDSLRDRGAAEVKSRVEKDCRIRTTDQTKAEGVALCLAHPNLLGVIAAHARIRKMAPGLTGGELLLCMIGFVMRDGGGEDVVQQWVQSILLPFVRDGFMAWEKHRARIQAFAMAYAKQVKASGGTLALPTASLAVGIPSAPAAVTAKLVVAQPSSMNKSKKRKRGNNPDAVASQAAAGSGSMSAQGKRQKKGKKNQAGKSLAYGPSTILLSYD